MRLVNVLLLAFLVVTHGFYLPGVAPHDYAEGEQIDIKVNKLDSVKTQMPYDYYSLPFCAPEEIEELAENLGEVLSGDRMETSLYEVRARALLGR
jgi:transmembrane 9 superfamily protein 2/4